MGANLREIELLDTPRREKALLVGNSPSVLEREFGREIDEGDWDAVIRFNRWEREDDGKPHADFSRHVGTRCDFWVVNDLRSLIGVHRRERFRMVLISTPRFKYKQAMFDQKHEFETTYPNVRMLPCTYEGWINDNVVDFRPKWATTGVIGMFFASLHFKEVWVHGFSAFDPKYKWHYFEDKTNIYKTPQIGHDPDKEKYFLEWMKRNRNVKELIDDKN